MYYMQTQTSELFDVFAPDSDGACCAAKQKKLAPNATAVSDAVVASLREDRRDISPLTSDAARQRKLHITLLVIWISAPIG
jgi:hypothetical protein